MCSYCFFSGIDPSQMTLEAKHIWSDAHDNVIEYDSYDDINDATIS